MRPPYQHSIPAIALAAKPFITLLMQRSSSPEQQGSSSRDSPAAGGPSAAQDAQLTAAALLELCEQLYDSFNAAQHTLDTHLHNSLQQLQHRLTEDEACFIQEVCVGTASGDLNAGISLNRQRITYRQCNMVSASAAVLYMQWPAQATQLCRNGAVSATRAAAAPATSLLGVHAAKPQPQIGLCQASSCRRVYACGPLLLQVVYGLLRFSRFLDAFLASFWDKNRCGHTCIPRALGEV